MMPNTALSSAPAFWLGLDRFSSSPALIDDGVVWSYARLDDVTRHYADAFASSAKKVVILQLERTVSGIACYFGLLRAGHAVAICGNMVDAEFVAAYRPDIILLPERAGLPKLGAGYVEMPPVGDFLRFESTFVEQAAPHADLTLLLSTSGSLGKPKLVRHSDRAVAVAAEQVREGLQIRADERAITALPFTHVYGLSVLHAQLSSGGALVLTRASVMDRRFWETFRRNAVTSMSGVPWIYQRIMDAGLEHIDIPSLRRLDQSGGRLAARIAAWLSSAFPPERVATFNMYGQTEAGGRISILPSYMARHKPNSVGVAVVDGCLACTAEGEIVYHGPNVMMGYATNRVDLAGGDSSNGRLNTGDLGRIDSDGCLYITGRNNRLSKVLGYRVSLDDVEDFFEDLLQVAAVSDDETIALHCEGAISETVVARTAALAERLCLPRHLLRLVQSKRLPRSASGKILYRKLTGDTWAE